MADGILNPIEQLEADFDFDVYTKQEVDALLDEKADKSDTYTKTETDALLNDKADADAVYTKTETDTLLSAKADKSTTLAGYGIADAYTKTQTDNLLNGKADADSVYTKSEIDTKIPNTVGSATKPTYVNGGVITECTYELNKTVPANAVFTDTTYSAGNGLNLSGTSFSAKAGTNVTVDGGGINVNGNGAVASADSGLISGGTAYTELRPTLDGTWVKNAQTTATNLQKLEGGIEYLYGLLSHQYDQLKKYINGNYYDYDTDTDSKYTKTVPQGAMPYASLDSIGGKTLVFNQLQNAITSYVVDSSSTGTLAGVTVTIADGVLTVNGTVTDGDVKLNLYPTPGSIPANHKLLYTRTGSGFSWGRIGFSPAGDVNAFINTYGSNFSGAVRVTLLQNVAYNFSTKFNVFDLTLLYGAGNEPSTVQEFTAQFPASYYSYNAGTLLSAGVTSVISKKADTTELATYSIPAEIRNLEGYGWSAGNKYVSAYNYIDYERKVFVQRLGKVTLTSADVPSADSGYIESGVLSSGLYSGHSYTNIRNLKYSMGGTFADRKAGGYCAVVPFASDVSVNNTDMFASQYRTYFIDVASRDELLAKIGAGVDMYYELETPIETDISAYLTDDNLIEVEAGGSLTFPNSNGTDYQIPVPSSETYMVDLQSAI